MEVSVTRSFLDVVSMLTLTFGDAVKQQLSQRHLPAALYVVHNQLDKPVELNLLESDFVVDADALAITRRGPYAVNILHTPHSRLRPARGPLPGP